MTPETADTLSWGTTLEPIENVRIDLDWSKTDFTDRIVSIDPQQLLDLDFFNSGFSGQPTYDQLAQWTATGADPRIERNPTDLTQILRVTVGQSSASKMLVEAYDIKVSYRFDLGDVLGGLVGNDDLGSITMNLQATKINTWEYQRFPTDPVSYARYSFNLTGLNEVARWYRGRYKTAISIAQNLKLLDQALSNSINRLDIEGSIQDIRFRPRLVNGIPQPATAILSYQLASAQRRSLYDPNYTLAKFPDFPHHSSITVTQN